MKKTVRRALVAGLLAAFLGTAGNAFAAKSVPVDPDKDPELYKVCHTIVPLGWHVLYKFQASGHLVGTMWQYSCSLIYGPGSTVPKGRSLAVYDGQGKRRSIFYEFARRHGNDGSFYNARFYTVTPACGTIARRIKKATGRTTGYIAIGNKQCYKITNWYGRYGAAY